MTPKDRWPYLCLLAGHVFYLGDPQDFHEIDRMELDRTESQLSEWIKIVAGELDETALKEKIKVTRRHRYGEAPDSSGMNPWLDYVFLFDHSEVLIEEVLSSPAEGDVLRPPIRMRRFRRKRFSECNDEIRRLFSGGW
jgi:hypothetical protein